MHSKIIATCLICFINFYSIDAFYRVQKDFEAIQKYSTTTSTTSNIREEASKHIKVQAALGSSCKTGCPGGCDITAGIFGKVMSAPVTLYHIYIGHSASDYAPGVQFRTVLDSLAVGLQNTPTSPYLNIFSGYTDSYGQKATQSFTFGGSYVYTYNSNAITEAVIANAIGAAINSNTSIYMDTTAIYTVFFRGDYSNCYTDYSGAPSCWALTGDWCGYHKNLIPTGQTQSVIYSTLGDTTYGSVDGCSSIFPPPTYFYDISSYYIGANAPPTCIDSVTYQYCTFGQNSTCTYCSFTAPNGDIPSDAAVTVYMHEVFEAITDGLDGFLVRDPSAQCAGSEIGDLCASSLSGITPSSSSGSYNLQLSNGTGGYLYFMVQDMFDHPTKVCTNGVLKYSPEPSSVPSSLLVSSCTDPTVAAGYCSLTCPPGVVSGPSNTNSCYSLSAPLCCAYSASPTSEPSSNPSLQPSPEAIATAYPVLIHKPTVTPTIAPTIKPTIKPLSIAPQSVSPTSRPVFIPTLLPTTSIVLPTVKPTSSEPSSVPSSDITLSPTSEPFKSTHKPSRSPRRPTFKPTVEASELSYEPTNPTSEPSSEPSFVPSSEEVTSYPIPQAVHEPTIKPTKKPVSIAPQNVSPTSRPVSAPTLLPFDSAVFPTVEPTSLAPQLISHTDDHHLELSCNLPSGTIGYLSTVMCPPEAYEAYKICHSFSGLCKFNYCCSYTPTSSPTLNPSINPTLNPLTNPTLNPANKKFNSTSSSNSSSNTVNASIGMYAGIGAAVVVIGAIALFVFFRFYASSNDKNTHFTAPGGHMTPAYATAESAYVKDTYKTIADPIRVSENPMRASPQKPRRNLEATSSTTTNSTLPITMESMNVKRTVTPVVPSAKPILKPTIEVVQQDSSPSTQPVNDSSDVNRSTTNPVVPSPKAISKPTETTIVIQQESTALGTYSTAAAAVAVATSKIDLGKTTTMATTAGSTTATTSSTTIPLTSLSEQQVISVMTVLGLSSYIDQFVDAALPGSLLSNIETVEDLTDCGISLPGPMAKLLLKFISRANENGVEQKYLK